MSDVDRNRRVGKQGTFYMPITNTLGVDASLARGELQSFALEHSKEYAKMRKEVYVSVVKHVIEDAHKKIWNLLSEGICPDGQPITLGDGFRSQRWSPSLPDSQCGETANGFAKSMKDMFDKILEQILPSDFKALADDKIRNIAKVEGIAQAM